MSFNVEELALVKESIRYRRMHYERINLGQFSSPEERLEAKEEIKKFVSLEKTLKIMPIKKEIKDNE
jgi:hypothetical protein